MTVLLSYAVLWTLCLFHWGSTAFNRPQYNQAMYLAKRRMHSEQVLRLAQSPYHRGAKLVAEICPHIFSVLRDARKQVEFIDMDAPDMNDTVGEAFATVFENTPYFLEWALLFPDTIQQALRVDSSHVDLVRWAIELTRSSGLLPEDDLRLFADAEQELNFVPRKPTYQNPYATLQNMMHANEEALYRFQKPQQKRKKRERRPRLTPRKDEL